MYGQWVCENGGFQIILIHELRASNLYHFEASDVLVEGTVEESDCLPSLQQQ